MKIRAIASCVSIGTVAVLSTSAGELYAQTCNNSSQCLEIDQQGSGTGLWIEQQGTGSGSVIYQISGTAPASYVFNESTGIGVQAIANGYGVSGLSYASHGVYGQASNSGTAAVYGSGTSSAEGVRGTSVNNNGIEGDTSSSGASGVYGVNSSTGGYGVAGSATGSGVAIAGFNTNSSGWAGYFTGKVMATAGYSSSDLRLKKNVKPLEGALDQVLRLHGVTFEWRDPEERGQGTQMGFIAQDFESVFPQWVTVDLKGYKAINTKGLEAMLVESVRTLRADNDALRVRTANLEDRVKALEANRRPLISGFGEGGIGFGLLALAGVLGVSQRKRSQA